MIPLENPKPPEGINVTQHNPIKELMVLSVSVCVIFALISFLVWQGLTLGARYIPLKWEARIAAPFVEKLSQVSPEQTALQARLDKILTAMNYDNDIGLTVHYAQADDLNAFATLGGQIIVFSALVEQIETDIGLDMVLAHEAAHIINRDPIQSAVGTLGIKLILALITGNGEFAQVSGLMGVGSQMFLLGYSRDQEREADRMALDALEVIYGDLNGADELFVQLNSEEESFKIPDFLSSHPHPEERIYYINERINE